MEALVGVSRASSASGADGRLAHSPGCDTSAAALAESIFALDFHVDVLSIQPDSGTAMRVVATHLATIIIFVLGFYSRVSLPQLPPLFPRRRTARHDPSFKKKMQILSFSMPFSFNLYLQNTFTCLLDEVKW